jgi:cytoskeletal protein CcmA (bactofilin family)
MWKREPESATTPNAPSMPPARIESEPVRERISNEPGGRAVIGPSIQIKGELSGGEDLLIEGRIEGKVVLAQHAVTVGAKGRLAADIHARAVHVEGEVEGNIAAEELIVLKKSARVRGDLVAPRVVIEDGARFKGSVDMETKRPAAAPAAPRPVAAEEAKRPADVVKAG